MYIYQRPEWWNFTYDKSIVIKPLSNVRRKQGELMGRILSLGFDIQSDAMLETLAQDTIRSSEIEGEVLNLEQVRSSIAMHLGLPHAGLPTPSHYIDGVVQMMLDATQRYSQPLTHARLFGWHAALFPMGTSGPYKIDVGQYRTHRMQIVSGAMGHERIHYEAPAPEAVPLEMERLVDWVNNSQEDDPVVQAAITHLWFVTIHPFDDGNGRMARALTDLLLARSDHSHMRFYSMSAAILQEKKQYYYALEQAQRSSNGDITEWVLWFLHCIDKALDHSQAVLGSTLRKANFWQNNPAHQFNERQRKIINRLFDGIEGKMTSSKYAKMCHCSQDTALNDLRSLVERGIIVPLGAGRGIHYELSM